jgi:hypothetical protein
MTGGEFWVSAKSSFQVMKRHFVDGFVGDTVGVSVLGLGAFFFSMLVGFVTWMGCAALDGTDPFNPPDGAADLSDSSAMLRFVIILLYIILLYNPLLGILFILAIPVFFSSLFGWAFAFGFMTAIIVHLFFIFMASVILNVVDSVFVCVAIDRENGCRSPHGKAIQDILSQSNWIVPDKESQMEKGLLPSAAMMPMQQPMMMPMQPMMIPMQQQMMMPMQSMQQPMMMPMHPMQPVPPVASVPVGQYY